MIAFIWLYFVCQMVFWLGLFAHSETTGPIPVLTRLVMSLLWPLVLLYSAASNIGINLDEVLKRRAK